MRIIVIEPGYDRWRRIWVALGPLLGPSMIRVRTVGDARDMCRRKSPDMVIVGLEGGAAVIPSTIAWHRDLYTRPPLVVVAGVMPGPEHAELLRAGASLCTSLDHGAPTRIAEVLIAHFRRPPPNSPSRARRSPTL
ncbi:MAG: hypothetical protein ACI9WU_005196, partial [Myxococcota bacterium]